MPKITETIELTRGQYESMEKARKRFNMTISEFITTSVKESIILHS